MSLSIRDAAYQLRQGQLLAIADETGWSVAADPTNDTAVRQLLDLQQTTANPLHPTVLVDHTHQVGLYVVRVPDIAYDLVEFADNPLTVVYPSGKNLSALLPQTEIAVRRSLSADVQRLIGGFGRGLLTVPFETIALPAAAEAVVTGRFGQLPGSIQQPRILSLGVNGEVKFLRK